jgi:PleD family two-component response regulator
LEAKPNQGKPMSQETPEQPYEESDIQVDAQRFRDKTVFIVDDDEIIIGLTTQILQVSGFTRIHGFTKSTEVFEILKFISPDLILTDIHMPELSGTFLAKLVSELPAHKKAPLLAITADASKETETLARRNGIFDIILKPIEGKQLLEKVVQTLEWAEAQQNNLDMPKHAKARTSKQHENNLYNVFGRSARR